MKKPFRYLHLVDLDGTIIDTGLANYMSYQKASQTCGFSFDIDFETFRDKYFGYHYSHFLKEIIPTGNSDIYRGIANEKTRIYDTYFKHTTLNRELVEKLKQAKPQDLVALCTSARKENALLLLKYHGIESLFDLVIAREDVSAVKPDPECFKKAIDHFKADSSQVIVYEDSLAGVEAARTLNLQTVHIKM